MALDAPVTVAAPSYCSADDVARVRRERPYAAEDPKRLTLTEVNERILDAEDDVDRTTRHSWRARKVTEEYHSLSTLPDSLGFIPIHLNHQMNLPLSSGSGDKVEVRSGSTWEDYLVTRTQGVGGDFWLNQSQGILYLKRRFFMIEKDAVRVTYRYGETAVPRDIKTATMLLAAALMEDTTRRAGSDGGDGKSVADRAEDWRVRAYSILARYQRVGGA